jgi:nucleoside-diphosphate-sugar epimerase
VARVGTARSVRLSQAGWREAIAAADYRDATVIHLAARHDARGAGNQAFVEDNVEKTRALALAAAAGRAVRFVLASTVKVFGEEDPGRPFGLGDKPMPQTDYSRSKLAAENCLREVALAEGLQFSILRIPLVYGPGAGGNFRSLLELADSGVWLPFQGIRNRRSFLHIDDLVDAIIAVATHEAARARTFIAAHPDPVATPDLIEAMRRALGRPPRMFRVPAAVIEACAALAGRAQGIRRLTRSLQVDPSALVDSLGWRPKFAFTEGIEDTVRRERESR